MRMMEVTEPKEHKTKVGDLCMELGVSRQTLYRFADLTGEFRADGAKHSSTTASTSVREEARD